MCGSAAAETIGGCTEIEKVEELHLRLGEEENRTVNKIETRLSTVTKHLASYLGTRLSHCYH